MRTAKVLVTDLSSKGKKIFHYGDTVKETDFHPGSFEKLLEGKFLEETFLAVEKSFAVDPPKTDLDENPDTNEKDSKNGDTVKEIKPDEKTTEGSFANNAKNNRKK